MPCIGVLALQGAFIKHCTHLETLGIATKLVRTAQDLEGCEALVIPGGESTTMLHHLSDSPLLASLKDFTTHHPVFGTCAGLILMSHHNILDIEVERNAYGRQVHSFTDHLPVTLNGKSNSTKATFIRAPKISRIGPSVEVISTYEGEPVAVKQDHHMGLAFHPELDGVTLFHQFVFTTQFESVHAA